MILTFDHAASTFTYEGVPIGPSTRLPDLQARLDGEVRDVAGQPGYQAFKINNRPLNLFLSFHQGMVHSGYFWASTEREGSWEEAGQIEAERRDRHVAITKALFGSHEHHDDVVSVYLVREPRSYLEQICFEFRRGGERPTFDRG